MPIEDVVPLYRLQLATERLTLCLAHPDELRLLTDVARAPIHPPGEEPFLNPMGANRPSWSSAPPDDRAESVIRAQFGAIARWSPADWHLELAIWLDGKPIGVQTLYAKHYPVCREVVTISWITLAQQGNGYGSEARAAVLALAFNALGARSARSRAFVASAASIGVSERLGYRDDGIDVEAVYGGEVRTSRRFRMSAEDWSARPRPAVTVAGFDDECRTWFGIDPVRATLSR
jgi:RimJ/RimL family protein N-acetyltransferase